jgi:integrase
MLVVSKPQGLIRRGNVFYYRRRVPLDLVHAFDGRRELKESLKTGDLARAKVRRNLVAAKFEASFDEARAKLNGTNGPTGQSRLTREAVRRYVQIEDEKRTREFAGIDWSSDPEATDDAKHEALQLAGYYKNSSHEATALAVSLAAREIGGENAVPSKTEEWEFLRRAILELQRRQVARFSQDFRRPWFDHEFANVIETSGPEISPIALSELVDQYSADYSATKAVGEKRRHKVSAALELILEFFGRDTAVHGIERRHCREFRNILNELPSNLRKHFPQGQASLQRIAAEAARRKLPVLARDTQDMYLGALKRLLRWAKSEGHILRDPSADLVPLGGKTPAKEARDPFTVEQLSKIFNAPLYRGCENDKDGYATPGQNVIRGTRFWVPLIALFTGMRLNEICQLDVADVKQSDMGTWYLSVDSNTSDKRVKNPQSKRQIPIHPELLEIGLLEFVEQRRQRSRKIFPDLKPSTRGYHSERMSRWFNEGFLPKVGLKTETTSFHSFRHSFRDALRTINAPPAVVEGIGGWTLEGSVSGRYGSGLEVDQLATWMARISFEGLELSHLHLRF